MQTSAFHAEAGFRERIAERRLLTLSRRSGDEAYRHEVYGKEGISVHVQIRPHSASGHKLPAPATILPDTRPEML